MDEGDLRKGVKRPTSEKDNHPTVEEEPKSELERLEAKRSRILSDIYNSDTGASPFG